MHEVFKVVLNNEIRYLTRDAFYLALGKDIVNNKCSLQEIESFTVSNATDLEDELLTRDE